MKYGETFEKDFMSGNNTHLSLECILENLAKEEALAPATIENQSPKEECEVIVDCFGENIRDPDSDLANLNEIEERYWKVVNGEEHCKKLNYFILK